jgi:hypothetical protein
VALLALDYVLGGWVCDFNFSPITPCLLTDLHCSVVSISSWSSLIPFNAAREEIAAIPALFHGRYRPVDRELSLLREVKGREDLGLDSVM